MFCFVLPPWNRARLRGRGRHRERGRGTKAPGKRGGAPAWHPELGLCPLVLGAAWLREVRAGYGGAILDPAGYMGSIPVLGVRWHRVGDHQITKASCEQNSPCFEEGAWGETSTSHGNEEMKPPKMDIVRLRKSYTFFGC